MSKMVKNLFSRLGWGS